MENGITQKINQETANRTFFQKTKYHYIKSRNYILNLFSDKTFYKATLRRIMIRLAAITICTLIVQCMSELCMIIVAIIFLVGLFMAFPGHSIINRIKNRITISE